MPRGSFCEIDFEIECSLIYMFYDKLNAQICLSSFDLDYRAIPLATKTFIST